MLRHRMNQRYFGDNLNVLRESIASESVDLIYLDPPFNSKRDYNLLFKSPKVAGRAGSPLPAAAAKSADGRQGTAVPTEDYSSAQITAFEDSWHWGEQAEREFDELVHAPNTDVSEMMQALRRFLGENDMMAYLTMMANRLLQLHRVLKPTGSIYLHCDPTASHYLKIVLDGVFGKTNFRNEIIWQRTNAHNKLSKQFGPIHDSLLFYGKTDAVTVKPGRRPYATRYVKESFPGEDKKGFYQSNVLTGAETRTGDSGKPWRNYDPTKKGRHWAIPSKLLAELPKSLQSGTPQEILEALDERGLILHPKGAESLPRYKQYLESSEGVLHQDIWAYQPFTQGILYNSDEGIDQDVKWLDADDEKLPYPTQKPVGLLERIIAASSNEGDVVLDPFCGCGTAVHAAQKLNRQWIGIDITHLAISLIEKRLKDAFKTGLAFEVHGTPKDPDAARDLATRDKYQFQWWAVSLVEAQPFQGKKKGADGGIDGLKFFGDFPLTPALTPVGFCIVL